MVSEDDISELVLVSGDPGRIERLGRFLKEFAVVSRHRGFVCAVGRYKGVLVTGASTGIGGASAAIALEELANAGAKVVIRVGTAGGLQPEVDVGHLVVATAAVRDDGVGAKYLPLSYPAVPDLDVLRALLRTIEERCSLKWHAGPVWTSSNYYLRSRKLIDLWRRAGVLAVEMECATLFVLAKVRGFKAGALLAIDGNLAKGTAKSGLSEKVPREAEERVMRAIEEEVKVALEALVRLSKGA